MTPTTLVARFTALPGHEEEVARLIADLEVRVTADPGTVFFRAFRLEEDGRRFLVMEQYEDAAAFAAHIAMPHGAEFNRRLAPLIEEPASELTFLRPARG